MGPVRQVILVFSWRPLHIFACQLVWDSTSVVCREICGSRVSNWQREALCFAYGQYSKELLSLIISQFYCEKETSTWDSNDAGTTGLDFFGRPLMAGSEPWSSDVGCPMLFRVIRKGRISATSEQGEGGEPSFLNSTRLNTFNNSEALAERHSKELMLSHMKGSGTSEANLCV